MADDTRNRKQVVKGVNIEIPEGLDLSGLGRAAEAIPEEVYKQSANVLLNKFQELLAPITETTAGLGRYLGQKFNTMVECEKAVAVFTVQKAVTRAQARLTEGNVFQPVHPKMFVKTIEEASKETVPVLHEMWANLLASQMTGSCHPHFVELLQHFGPDEAHLFSSLLARGEATPRKGGYVSYEPNSFRFFITKDGGEVQPWTISCSLLIHFQLALPVPPPDYPHVRGTTLLCRTLIGDTFKNAIS